METLRINIAKELKAPSRPASVELEVTFSELELMGKPVCFLAPVRVLAQYCYDGEAVDVRGSIDFTLKDLCAYCGDECKTPVHVDFDERFLRGTADDDEEAYTFSGEILDLTDMVTDAVYLHVPIVAQCKADCKGLCPVCGCNLNHEQCTCRVESVESFAEDSGANENAFAGLGRLLIDDKEV